VEQTFEGRPIDLVFTNPKGGVAQRQAVTKVIRSAARDAGLDPEGLSTHTGRRTVVTTPYSEEGIDLADVARHVGHASPTTTAGYIRGLGQRPKATSEAAARRLDVVP
jgi:integrase